MHKRGAKRKIAKGTLTFFMLYFVFGLGTGTASDGLSKVPYKKLRLPSGNHYPVSQSLLLHLRDKADRRASAEIRAHAWDVFAGLTKASPIWDTWYTKCDVRIMACAPDFDHKNPKLHPLLRSFEVPLQTLDSLSARAPNSGGQTIRALLDSAPFLQILTEFAQNQRANPQFAAVLFNRPARDHINKNCLRPRDPSSKRDASCPHLPDAPRKIKNFKRSAIVLKTSWRRVVPDENGIGELSTWSSDLWNIIQKPNTFKPRDFGSAVIVDTTKEAQATVCRDGDFGDSERVPLSCFYYIQLTAEDVAELQKSPKGFNDIRDAGVNAGDYLVLVAVHVTTKEIPEWTWATFWWDLHAGSDPRAAGRPGPDKIEPRWRHFLMESTLSGITPRESDGGPKICFNPYLETGVTNGTISNCLQCHSKASYGPNSGQGYNLGILSRDGKTLASNSAPPNDQDYFSKQVQTDFMWSIANSLRPDIQDLRTLFQTTLRDLELEDLRLKQLKIAPK
jgi:hypothetical protein